MNGALAIESIESIETVHRIRKLTVGIGLLAMCSNSGWMSGFQGVVCTKEPDQEVTSPKLSCARQRHITQENTDKKGHLYQENKRVCHSEKALGEEISLTSRL